MLVSELFRRLSFTELSNLQLGLEGAGGIEATKKDRIILYANKALIKLYGRFVIKENDVMLNCHELITNYHLLKQFAATNPAPDPTDTLYLIDTADDPFEEDVLRILRVIDGEGRSLPLNDEANLYSLFTPQPNVLQVPEPVQDTLYRITYQAKHPELPYGIDTTCIDLPDVLEEALTAYIAYLVYSNMNGQDNSTKAMEHYNRYEAICNEVVDRDLINSTVASTLNKFSDRGWC